MNARSQEAPQALRPQRSFRTLPDGKAHPCKNKSMPRKGKINRITRNLKFTVSATPAQTESIAARPCELGHSDGPAESP